MSVKELLAQFTRAIARGDCLHQAELLEVHKGNEEFVELAQFAQKMWRQIRLMEACRALRSTAVELASITNPIAETEAGIVLAHTFEILHGQIKALKGLIE